MTSAQVRQLTRVLGVVVAALGLCYLLLLFGLGRGVPGPGQVEPDAVANVQLAEAQVELPQEGRFLAIAHRPLFSEDRRAEPKTAPQTEEPAAETPPSAPLNVSLTGIIHTPSARIALVRDNSSGRSLNLREGAALPGDQGGWRVKRIEPRRVVFDESGADAGAEGEAEGSETVVELAITGSAAAAAPGMPPPPPPPAATNAPEEDEVARRAAEIRRRIEERRAQLRREAEEAQKQ